MTAPLLALDGVDTFYGPVQVHFGLTLEIRAGQVVCLLGGNARGKSTTMKVIPGLLKPRAGHVRFDGQDITGLPTPQVIRRGIGSVPEARRLFGAMTVRENLLMGAFARTDRAEVARDLERMLDLFLRVRQRLSNRGRTLSGGEQQMVAMARALMGRPRRLSRRTRREGDRSVTHMPGLPAPTPRQAEIMSMAEGLAARFSSRASASLTKGLPLERYFRDARAGLFQPPQDDLALGQIGRAALARAPSPIA